MLHRATASFWKHYAILPADVRDRADKSFRLLKADPRHPSLHFKQIGDIWSARVGRGHRALALESEEGFDWFWIGSHDEYERLLKN